jgi:rod shape determining protein RodA
MSSSSEFVPIKALILFGIVLLVLLGTVVLRSIVPEIYPAYFVYLIVAVLAYYLFVNIDFQVLVAFSSHLYVASIVLLVLPLAVGQVTRGAIRWIPIGPLTFQPSEIVRPFLLFFAAKYLSDHKLDIGNLIKFSFLILLPLFLILIQPSLGVSILTGIGFLGVIIASGNVNKKLVLLGIMTLIGLLPIFWLTLKPYQKQRVATFLNPYSDPLGAGYNSIQSMIAVGSGRLFGRGLGEGVQTQLAFLPERHTDFVFAAVAEEMGFIGAILVFVGLAIVFWNLIGIAEQTKNLVKKAYVIGIFFVLFFESMIHIGMNMGMLPITGVPLPFVSAGGSALLGTTIAVSLAMNKSSQ